MDILEAESAEQIAPAQQSSLEERKQNPHLDQLDGLRAIAIFAVLVFHLYEHSLTGRIPLGLWGVQLFFVLSGFLITGILLKGRPGKAFKTSRRHLLRQFYIRRSLRIFPLFYLVLFITAVLNIDPVRQTLVWHLAYASNFFFALHGWQGAITPFWSLAVEEQFYLLWPWLILFLPDKYLLPCVIAAILLTPLYKIIGYAVGLTAVTRQVMAIGCLDSLGMGALLALCRHKNPLQFKNLAQSHSSLWTGFTLLCMMVSGALYTSSSSGLTQCLSEVVSSMLAAMFFAWVLHRAVVGFTGLVGYLLTLKPLLYCGRISYGLYLYHNFMPQVVPRLFSHMHFPYPQHPIPQFILLVTLTVLVAGLSWHFFERPINNLKHRFQYAGS